jgi:hypothetical protein
MQGTKPIARPIAMLVALTMMVAGALMLGTATTASSSPDTATRGVVGQSSLGKMTSKVKGRASDGSKVTGTFTPLKFVKKNGKQQVKGVIEGVMTRADGSKERFTAVRTTKVKSINGRSLSGLTAKSSAQALATCDILHLVLGPLDLNLLGLQVNLNRIVLDIVAVTGAGNLLGNLLCAVTGLLDGGPLAGLLGQLNNLLNQILAALNLGI